MISELRPYQLQALDAIRDSVRGGVKRLVVQAPTGSGKTKLAAAIVDGAMAKGNRTAFVVPAISLIDQTVESFYAEGIREIGVIQASHQLTNWSRPVQVCSIQTIQARKAWPEAKTVIFDECHRLHDAHKRWLADAAWQHVPFIGLSATPWTKGLGKHFSSLLVAATINDLIAQGHLSKFRVFATGHPDLSGVKIVAGEYHEGELSDAMQQGELTADIVRTWREKFGQGKTLCFGVDKAHAKSIQERFEEAGVPCGYQDADTTDDERREIKRKFHNGDYQVVSNIQTLTTGVDWDCRCLILARPTRSEMLFVQIVGRALRTATGKDAAIILDHSDTTQRLGFVTDIHHEGLDDGKGASKQKQERKKPPLPKECKQCTAILPAALKVCPNCGFETKPVSGVVEREGELIELTSSAMSRKRGRTQATMAEKASFFSELKGYGIQHNRKPGWAAWSYKAKFGVWPDRSFQDISPRDPSIVTVQWVRSRNIAWAKSKRKAESAAHA